MSQQNFLQKSEEISELVAANRSVFLRLEPEVPDFTAANPFKIHVYGTRTKVELEVTTENLMHVIGLFDLTVFNPEVVDRLYVWNIKALASYFRYFVKKFLQPKNSIIDLKIIEAFLGTRRNCPENLVEAVNRMKLCVAASKTETNTQATQAAAAKGWQSVYKAIHLPLALQVLPSIETTPLLNEEFKRCEHPYYEIEGQVYGRMNCLKKYSKGYSPHNMGPDVKRALKPRGEGVRFLVADFRHCEVTVLQWLSGDPKLKELLESGKDLHGQIYEIITGTPCDNDNKRRMSKLMFLPVMFGCGARTLAENMGVPENVAAELISRIKTVFSVAWEWMRSKQDLAKVGAVIDSVGRPRTFSADQTYLVRDFVVQGVAATVCQEKLIALHKVLDGDNATLAFSVHDGYGLVIKTKFAKEVYRLVKDVTESESKICPGLKMKVEVKFGAKLDAMKVLWRD